ASTYDRATASTSAGRVKFQASAGSPIARPRFWNSVPQAPSVMTGPVSRSDSSRLNTPSLSSNYLSHPAHPSRHRHGIAGALSVAVGPDVVGILLGYRGPADQHLDMLTHAGPLQGLDGR